MWKIAASAAGRLTVGIQGTSLSMTSTHVGRGQGLVLPRVVPLAALVERMVGGEVHRRGHQFEDARPQRLGEAHELAHRRRAAAEVGGDDQRPPGGGEGREDLGGGLLRQRQRRNGVPAAAGCAAGPCAGSGSAASITSRAPMR